MLFCRCYRKVSSERCGQKDAMSTKASSYSGMQRGVRFGLPWKDGRCSSASVRGPLATAENCSLRARAPLASASRPKKTGHSGLQLLLYALELGEMPFSTNQRSDLKKCRHTSCRYTCADTILLTWYTNAKPMEKKCRRHCADSPILRKTLFTSLVDCGL